MVIFEHLWLDLPELGGYFPVSGLENIAKILDNRAAVAQNHDARKALPATLSVLK